MANVENMEQHLETFLRRSKAIFEDMNVQLHEWDRATHQMFLKVPHDFTEQHKLAIETYLQQFDSKALVGIIRDRVY